MAKAIIDIKNLKKYFPTPAGMLHAVDDVSFSINQGKTLGLVGESGCGKSTLGRSIIRLIEPTAGSVKYKSEDILKYSSEKMRLMRREMQLIFQDPYTSLDPRMTVSNIIAEPLKLYKLVADKKSILNEVVRLMELVGLSDRLVNTYPHELDGGRRQRVGIARALALKPDFIVCDEPVSSLDVSIQAQILNLMAQLQEQMNLTYLFITHDLAVVNHFADNIAVMYLGRLVEMASSAELFSNPLHPYTKALLSAIPVPSLHGKRQRVILKGEITSPINPPKACRFAARCNYASERCFNEEPVLSNVGDAHFVSCFLLSDA
jgi:oligopeptide/dipeptide ABC transporter ATP-binding protein